MDKTLTRSIKKAEIAMGIIRRGLYKFQNFPVTLIFKIFDSMIAPIIMYGVEVWGGNLKKNIIDGLGVRICKEILGVGRHVFNEAVLDD